MIDATGEMATSCMSFLRSKSARETFRQLMAAGDVAELGTRRRTSSEEVERKYREVKRIYVQGMSVAEAARHANLEYTTARRRLIEEGILRPKRKPVPKHVKRAAQLKEKGLTWEEIGEKLGRSKASIRMAVKRWS